MAKLESSLFDIADLAEPYKTYESFLKTGVDILHDKINQRILRYERWRGHRVDFFSIDHAYIPKSRKRFDPSDIRTWDKRDIITKWMTARKSKREGVMELFCVITEDMVPKDFHKSAQELYHDLKHGLEEAYSGQEIPAKKLKEAEEVDSEGMVMILLFRFDFVATDLELFHNVLTLRDAFLKPYTDVIVQRIRNSMEDYFSEKEVDADDVKLIIGATHANEGNRLVFDRLKFSTWVVRGLTECCEELGDDGRYDATLVSALALTEDVLPKFLQGYTPKHPYESVKQDLALNIVEAMDRFAREDNDGKLCGLELDVDEMEQPWTVRHGAAVVYFAHRSIRTQASEPEETPMDITDAAQEEFEASDPAGVETDQNITIEDNALQIDPDDGGPTEIADDQMVSEYSAVQESVVKSDIEVGTFQEVDATGVDGSSAQEPVDDGDVDHSDVAADPGTGGLETSAQDMQEETHDELSPQSARSGNEFNFEIYTAQEEESFETDI